MSHHPYISSFKKGEGAVLTTSNVGTGEGLAKALVGQDAPFKSLLGTADQITLVGNTNDVTFSLNALVALLNVAQTRTADLTFSGADLILDDNILQFGNANTEIHGPTSIVYDVATGQTHTFRVNNIAEVRIGATKLDLLGNDLSLSTGGIIATSRATGDIYLDDGTSLKRFAVGADNTILAVASTTLNYQKIVNDLLTSGVFSNITGLGAQSQTLDMSQEDISGIALMDFSLEANTIATGVITPTRTTISLDTEASAATDDLDTITNSTVGIVYLISSVSSGRDPTLKDGVDNLELAGDFTLTDIRDSIFVRQRNSTNIIEVSRSDNS